MCVSSRLTVGVEHVAGEPHLGRTERIIGREAENGWKNSTLEAGVLRTPGRTIQQHTQTDNTTPEWTHDLLVTDGTQSRAPLVGSDGTVRWGR